MELIVFAHWLRNKFSPREWISKQIGKALAAVFAWAFSYRTVQKAIVKRISCDTPIGAMLNEHIESHADVESAVESAVEEAFEHHKFTVDADDVDGLDRFVESAIEEYATGSDCQQQIKDAVEEALNESLSEVLSNADGFEDLIVEAIETDAKRKWAKSFKGDEPTIQ